MSLQIPDSIHHHREYKRERKHNAQSLPPGLTHEMMKKYVVYYRETFEYNGKTRTREYFKVEGHPKLLKVSIKPWISTKSGKVSLIDKLSDANNVVTDLEENVYPSSHYIDPTTTNSVPKSLEQSILTEQKDGDFSVNTQLNIWTKLLPKYVSIRHVREIPDGNIKFIITFDKKDKMNSYRWTMSHRFILQTHSLNNDYIFIELEKLRKKIIEKYEMDIMSIA